MEANAFPYTWLRMYNFKLRVPVVDIPVALGIAGCWKGTVHTARRQGIHFLPYLVVVDLGSRTFVPAKS